MNKKITTKSAVILAGASFAISLAASPAAMADSNPFGMTKVSSASIQVAANEGKCGEGKCGGSMKKMDKAEGKCGEGKCGGKMDNKMKDGKCGGDKADMNKGKAEGKCGEGKCGGMK